MPKGRVQVFFDEPSLTRQEFKDSCDLGLTLKRFANNTEVLSNILNPQNGVQGRYEDVTQIPDYRQALEVVNSAKAKFMALDANIRKRFSNDPAEFVDFCTNPDNLDELRKLGLAKSASQNAAESPVLKDNNPKNSEGI